MPQRKKGRQNNKKNNKKNKPGYYGNEPKRRAAKKDEAQQSTSSSSGSCLEGERPSNFKEYIDRRRQDIQDNFKTFYVRYKEATKRFIDYMINETPDYVGGNRKSVNFVVVAADWMAESDFVLDPSILKDLKLSIRMRSRAAKSVFGGGDAGHAHLLSCLVYCWTVLISLPRLGGGTNKQGSASDAEEEAKTETYNRFEALMEEDEDDEEEDEEMFPSTPVPRPEPEPEIAMTIEQLKTADDRNDIILFLLNLDELMGFVINQYKCLVHNLRANKSKGVPASALIEETIEGAVATNMAIQLVQQLEMDLQQQHPHLTTPFRMLSTLVLPEITQNIAQIVREQDQSSKPDLEKEIAIFLGDCLECHFRSPSDPFNKSDTVVKEFCAKLKVNESGTSEIQKIFEATRLLVMFEAPFFPEKQSMRDMLRNSNVQSMLGGHQVPQDHSWLSTRNMPNIGGDRSIIHTLRLLQSFSAVITDLPDNRIVEPKRGFFGPTPWTARRVKKIHGDLDELVMSDIFPGWVTMCRKGIWGSCGELPRESELVPLFVLMRQFVKNPGTPVSFSLTFGFHAMLTSILETSCIFNEIVNLYELVFNNYFDQLDFAMNLVKREPDTELSTNKAFPQNMMLVRFLQNFGREVFGKHALWNPVCAGTTFSYLCFFGNLEAGCLLIDCQAQLRITLHLFNALKVNGILKEGQIPFLDKLHKCFKSSRGVWEGPLPQRGELVQRFWICFGMSIKHAKEMAEKSKIAVQRRQMDSNFKTNWGKRKMKPIEPAEIAKSYRRICNRDFHDVVDKYHSDDQRRRTKGTEIYACAVRTNDTLDAIDVEQQLLSLNLPACGVLIEQFVCSLGRVLQWGPLLQMGLQMGGSVLNNQMRQGYAILFAQYLLGALDFAHDPMDHELIDGFPMGRTSAAMMEHYFRNLDPSKAMWFQAVEWED